jgi:hypothetical protein
MTLARRALFTLTFLFSPCAVATAQEGAASIFDLRPLVAEAAFDPTVYFPSRVYPDASFLRVTYTGDDYGWPIHAFAVAEGCVDREPTADASCRGRLRARMARAPASAETTRPRHRGVQLLSRLAEQGATTPPLIRAALTDLGVEWLEADLRTCPGATEALRSLEDVSWTPVPSFDLDQLQYVSSLVMHADYIRLDVRHFARTATYAGWIAPNSPGLWAVEFAEVLEPCWRPAPVPPPWSPTD